MITEMFFTVEPESAANRPAERTVTLMVGEGASVGAEALVRKIGSLEIPAGVIGFLPSLVDAVLPLLPQGVVVYFNGLDGIERRELPKSVPKMIKFAKSLGLIPKSAS